MEEQKHTIQTEEYRHLLQMMIPAHNRRDTLLSIRDGNPLQCITSVLTVFSSIVREFLELFYNLWRTVLAKNKIVLDSALRLQSFRTPENATIGVRSGVECQQQERWRPSSRLF
ncbi:hypothetical protein TNCV_76031 [Trichonephila clavipes]|nr:hypothetical protein TNCV_76031 [Trichonephila clavipes]